jgi:HK97 family phage major capsid protein
MNALAKKLIAEMGSIIDKADGEARAFSAEEVAKIEEIKASVRAMEDMPQIPEVAAPETRAQSQGVVPGQPGQEFRALITTTGSAVLDGTKAEAFWAKVRAATIIRQFAKEIVGNGKADIPVGAAGGFASNSIPDAATLDAVKLSAKTYKNKIRMQEELMEDASFDIESAILDMTAADWADVEDLYVLQGSASGMAGVFAQLDAANRKVVSASFTVAKLLETIAKLKARHLGGAKAFVTPAAYGIILQGLDQTKQISMVGGKIYLGNVEVAPIDGLTVAHALVLNPAEVAFLKVREVATRKLVEVGAEAGEIIFLSSIRVDAKLRDTGALAALTAS